MDKYKEYITLKMTLPIKPPLKILEGVTADRATVMIKFSISIV